MERAKRSLSPRPLLLPLPALLASAQFGSDRSIITLAWGGIVSSEPPRLTLGIREDRFTYGLIARSREFAINLPDEALLDAVKFCGSKSGKDVNKFGALGLTSVQGEITKAPMIKEAPINLECRLEDIIKVPGSHHIFLGEIVKTHIREDLLKADGTLDYAKAGIISFAGGKYWAWGNLLP